MNRMEQIAEDRRKLLEVGVSAVRNMAREYQRALDGSRYATPQDALASLEFWANTVETTVLEPERIVL